MFEKDWLIPMETCGAEHTLMEEIEREVNMSRVGRHNTKEEDMSF